jgi:SRSO17 transposase
VCDASANLWQRLDSYAELFANCFRRRDQARWLAHYLHGLLTASGRKNVEGLARELGATADPAVADPVQALQNFINQSPWDERLLWRRFRALQEPTLARPDGVLAINDVGFLKQGQQSVGVQRQYWSRLRRKVNCQLAVAISHVSPAGVWPLALRLYLPKSWSNDADRLALAAVPPRHRSFRTRAEIALDLLEELRSEQVPIGTVVAGAGYGASPEFRRAMRLRGWQYLAGVPGDFLVQVDRPRPQTRGPAFGTDAPLLAETASAALAELLGLDSGRRGPLRTWIHARAHAAWPGEDTLVLYGAHEDGTRPVYALGSFPEDLPLNAVARLWDQLHQVEDVQQRLTQDLGLTHFEGRSWRGFHHHACLVMLAYGFLQREGLVADATRTAGSSSARQALACTAH